MDWMKGVLAFRPAGDAAGDTPDAIASRLQSAVDRHDFAAATPLFAQLPPPMLDAAGDLPQEVSALADASAFIAGLRAKALAAAPPAAKAEGTAQ